LTICSTPQPVEPALHREFNANKDAVQDLHSFPYRQEVENIADLESQAPRPTLLQMELYLCASPPLIDYIAEPLPRDTESCFETTLKTNPNYLFPTHELYKSIQCGIKMKGMKMYYDNLLKEANSALRFPSFNIGNRAPKLMAGMPDDQALGEWELQTIEDMIWNDNYQRLIKYWS
jgi:hypothetical protein